MTHRHLDVKNEIIAACLRLQELGHFIGTYGNISVRVPGGLIITPSRVDYNSLNPEDLVTVSDEGRRLEGARPPSSELEVHRQVYSARTDVGSVVHTHSLWATALSCLHQTVPVIVEEQSQVVGDEIRCTNYVPAGQHEKLGAEVARVLGSSGAALLANHGVVVCGRTLGDALFASQVVERVAQMRLLCSSMGHVVPIPREFVVSERERWLHKYGTAADGAIQE